MIYSNKTKNIIEKLKIYESRKNEICTKLQTLIQNCPELQNKVEIGLLKIEPITKIKKKKIISFSTEFKKFN